jgi:hypothetical protein
MEEVPNGLSEEVEDMTSNKATKDAANPTPTRASCRSY